MTRQEAEVVAAGLMIPQPFAAGDGDHPAAFKPIDNEPISNDVNFVEGFTPAFAAPGSQGGRYVTRQEMNAIGYLASVNEFKRQTGGINTYNPILAAKIGGYPKGAVLEYLDVLNYYRVISLVDNNLIDFNEVGVDGVNWAYCERGIVEDKTEVLSYFKELNITGSFGTFAESANIGSFIAQKSGTITFDGIMGCEVSEGVNDGGFVLVIHENSQGLDPLETQFDVFYGRGTMMMGGPSVPSQPMYWSSHQKVCSVTKDAQYTMFIIGMKCSFAGNGFKIGIL